MGEVYTRPKQSSLCRTGLEVYKTDEKHFKPYVSSAVITSSSKENNDDDEGSKGYNFHQGAVQVTYHYGNLESTTHEYDYKDMNNNASLKIESIDKYKFYKGVRVNLRKQWEAPGKQLQWDDLSSVLTGFITEQTFSEDGVEIKVSGMSKLLDEKYNFKFTNMKRSKILKEIIKTAGLTPVINVNGLDDDVTSFTTQSSSSKSSSSDLPGGEGEEIDSLVAKICKGITDDLKKCKAIHEWLKNNVKYDYYECTKYNTPEKCLKNKSHLNCADTARLTRAMMASAGLNCYVVHRTTDGGHFWTIIEIGGKKYASDQTGSGSDFNTVWKKSGRTSVSDGGSYTRKNGKNPDC